MKKVQKTITEIRENIVDRRILERKVHEEFRNFSVEKDEEYFDNIKLLKKILKSDLLNDIEQEIYQRRLDCLKINRKIFKFQKEINEIFKQSSYYKIIDQMLKNVQELFEVDGMSDYDPLYIYDEYNDIISFGLMYNLEYVSEYTTEEKTYILYEGPSIYLSDDFSSDNIIVKNASKNSRALLNNLSRFPSEWTIGEEAYKTFDDWFVSAEEVISRLDRIKEELKLIADKLMQNQFIIVSGLISTLKVK